MAIELIQTQNGPRIHVPLDLRRRCGRKQIVIRNESVADYSPVEQDPSDGSHHDALVIAIARALRWKKLPDASGFQAAD